MTARDANGLDERQQALIGAVAPKLLEEVAALREGYAPELAALRVEHDNVQAELAALRARLARVVPLARELAGTGLMLHGYCEWQDMADHLEPGDLDPVEGERELPE